MWETTKASQFLPSFFFPPQLRINYLVSGIMSSSGNNFGFDGREVPRVLRANASLIAPKTRLLGPLFQRKRNAINKLGGQCTDHPPFWGRNSMGNSPNLHRIAPKFGPVPITRPRLSSPAGLTEAISCQEQPSPSCWSPSPPKTAHTSSHARRSAGECP